MERTLKVGIASGFLITLIAVFILWKSDLKHLVSGYKLIGRFDHVGGLLMGADVRYRGYKVGKVSQILPGPKEIVVEIWIDNMVTVTEGSKLKIQFDGLVGENFVGVEPNENSDIVMAHGDTIYGSTGSDLAGFLDLGAQNLVHAEAILSSLREFISSDDTVNSFKKITQALDTLTENLNELMLSVNTNNVTSKVILSIDRLDDISARLDQASIALFEDEEAVALIVETLRNISKISQNLKETSEGDAAKHVENTLSNLDRFTTRLNRLFPEEIGEGSNIIQKIAEIKLKSDTSIKYASMSQKAYLDTFIDFKSEKYFLKTGFGNRYSDSLSFQHIQQGIILSPQLTTRLGLFYNNTGIAFDFFPNKKLGVSLELYEGIVNSTNFEVDLVSRYKLRKDLDLMFGIHKNQIDRKFNEIDTGMSYHF